MVTRFFSQASPQSDCLLLVNWFCNFQLFYISAGNTAIAVAVSFCYLKDFVCRAVNLLLQLKFHAISYYGYILIPVDYQYKKRLPSQISSDH